MGYQRRVHGTILKMRTFLSFLAVLACAQGNAVSRQQCPVQGADLLQRLAGVQLENINLKKAAGEEVSAEFLGLPRTTDDCGWDTGLACAGDIGSAVLDCAGIFVNPLEIVSCVQDAIGAGHDCWPCICWVIEWVLGDGYCGDL